jgi:hypothetical protein
MNALAITDIPTITMEPSWDGWCEYGRSLKQHEARLTTHIRDFRFIVARWYEYGVEHWRRPAERIAREIGFDPETIQNWVWTARHTEQLRASGGDGLEYEHYRLLAVVRDPEQQRALAERAKRDGLSGAQLRREIKRIKSGDASPRGDSDAVRTVRYSAIERLIDDLCAEAERLLASGDPIAQAQADVKLDCAARLRAAVGAK